jgi:hypothetical protein
MVEVKRYKYYEYGWEWLDSVYMDFTRLLFAKDMPEHEIKAIFAKVCAEELKEQYEETHFDEPCSIDQFIENEFDYMEASIYQIYE